MNKKELYDTPTVISSLISSIGLIISWSSYDWTFNWIMLFMCYAIIICNALSRVILSYKGLFNMTQLFISIQMAVVFIFHKWLMIPSGYWEVPVYRGGLIIALIGIAALTLVSVKNFIQQA